MIKILWWFSIVGLCSCSLSIKDKKDQQIIGIELKPVETGEKHE